MWFRRKKEREAAQAGRMHTIQESAEQKFPDREINSMQESWQAGENDRYRYPDAGEIMPYATDMESNGMPYVPDTGSSVMPYAADTGNSGMPPYVSDTGSGSMQQILDMGNSSMQQTLDVSSDSMQQTLDMSSDSMQQILDTPGTRSSSAPRTSGTRSSSVRQTPGMGSAVQQSQRHGSGAVQKSAGGQNRRKVLVPVLHLYQYMEQGNRKYQQDAIYVSATGTVPLSGKKMVRVLAVVCDGMGGMEDGGKASRTAVQILGKDFAKIKDDPGIQLPAFLLSEVQRIDRLIYHYSGGASGTTVVAAAVENDRLYWISAGDSRMYLLRQGRLERQTQDHNYMLHLMQMGMSAEEARAQKGSGALTSFLGVGNIGSSGLIGRNLRPIRLQVNDILLLCSDGITKTIPDGQIREILMNQAGGASQKARMLVQTATRKNTRSQDNTSALVLEYAMEKIDGR